MYQFAGQAVEDPNTTLQEVFFFFWCPHPSVFMFSYLFPESPSSHISSSFKVMTSPINAPVPRLQHYLPTTIILVAILPGIYLPLH